MHATALEETNRQLQGQPRLDHWMVAGTNIVDTARGSVRYCEQGQRMTTGSKAAQLLPGPPGQFCDLALGVLPQTDVRQYCVEGVSSMRLGVGLGCDAMGGRTVHSLGNASQPWTRLQDRRGQGREMVAMTLP